MGVSGRLVTPAEAESEFRRSNETLPSRWLPSRPPISSRRSPSIPPLWEPSSPIGWPNTRIPERAVLSFVRFELTNHLQEAATLMAGRADVTNQMEQLYQQRGQMPSGTIPIIPSPRRLRWRSSGELPKADRQSGRLFQCRRLRQRTRPDGTSFRGEPRHAGRQEGNADPKDASLWSQCPALWS